MDDLLSYIDFLVKLVKLIKELKPLWSCLITFLPRVIVKIKNKLNKHK